ncbi:hypothetical protein PTH_2861 [Pelotomaculum thermopropionicum SI]|uniref:Uncharacterized protein n=1 Tax=Pelotomaculum thermopropionicum (strain DSM 13744 / JCM 10971 / SI) TaxID=370438 RepID=A5CY86_PELTS|nr:hypothetical protein PTH_2861 [Pelotomaculum thermopropionicum SI]
MPDYNEVCNNEDKFFMPRKAPQSFEFRRQISQLLSLKNFYSLYVLSQIGVFWGKKEEKCWLIISYCMRSGKPASFAVNGHKQAAARQFVKYLLYLADEFAPFKRHCSPAGLAPDGALLFVKGLP